MRKFLKIFKASKIDLESFQKVHILVCHHLKCYKAPFMNYRKTLSGEEMYCKNDKKKNNEKFKTLAYLKCYKKYLMDQEILKGVM